MISSRTANQSLQRTAGSRPGWQSEHLARLSLSLGRSAYSSRGRSMHRFVIVFFASFFFFSSVFCHCISLAENSVDDDSKSGKSSSTYPFDRDTEKIGSELRSSQEAAKTELAEEFAIAAKRLV